MESWLCENPKLGYRLFQLLSARHDITVCAPIYPLVVAVCMLTTQVFNFLWQACLGLWNTPVAWHMQACVIEGNFPPLCVPGGSDVQCTCSQDSIHHKAKRAAQCHTELCHTVPHGAMLFLSHAAPEQMADGQGGQNNCGHGWQTPLISVVLNHPLRIGRIMHVLWSTCLQLDPLRIVLLINVSVGLNGGILTSCWGPWELRQKTSPLSCQLVWWPLFYISFHRWSAFTRCIHEGTWT